jgi:hypothetical protein
MSHANENKVKSSITTLNLPNTINNNNNNNKVSITKTFLYCNTCGKSIQQNPILCYIFIDYFCSEKCHVQKHMELLYLDL